MKKLIISLLSIALMTTLFAGCTRSFDPLASDNRQESAVATQATEKATEAETEAKTYEDNYDGLESYMNDKGYIKAEEKFMTEMKADVIGAEKGYLYNNGNVSIELYSFPAKATDASKKTIDDVKANGYYTIYDVKIHATLSDNEKYLMIYSDPSIKGEDSQEYKNRENAIADFKAFNK